PLATASTSGGADSFRATCGAGSGRDIAYEWVVPPTSYYSLNTFGSGFDTVLAVRDGSCTGPEIACNNNSPTTLQSEIIRSFTANQHDVVVIDRNAGDQGNAVFNVQLIVCPPTDLTGQS